MAHKFEIYKDKKGEYRVRFKYNSEVMFASEGYSSKSSATNAIASFPRSIDRGAARTARPSRWRMGCRTDCGSGSSFVFLPFLTV